MKSETEKILESAKATVEAAKDNWLGYRPPANEVWSTDWPTSPGLYWFCPSDGRVYQDRTRTADLVQIYGNEPAHSYPPRPQGSSKRPGVVWLNCGPLAPPPPPGSRPNDTIVRLPGVVLCGDHFADIEDGTPA